MPPTPPPTSPTGLAPSGPSLPPNNEQYRVIRKRNRVPLSCAPCRNRKLKCNRSAPCENCVKRGDAGSCSYAAPGGRRKAASRVSPSQNPDDMQNRINRLEGLVLSLMTQDGHSAPAAAQRALSLSSASQEYSSSQPEDMLSNVEEEGESETDQVASSLGVLHVHNNNKTIYIGEAHWSTILNDITEVKNYFLDQKKINAFSEQMTKVRARNSLNGGAQNVPAFLLGGGGLPRFVDLLAAVPSRDAVDKIVAQYFTTQEPSIHILHPPTWRRLYERHWQDPNQTDPAFLGQLFAIMGLAMQSYHEGDDEPFEYRGRTLNLAANYRALTSQCLMLVDYYKPVSYLLETFVLHIQAEFWKTKETDISIWILVGMATRLAMRMGLHRDPKHYPDLTPFMGEMRRRIWTYIRMCDLLFSFQVGLPSMIRSSGDSDTEQPRNIYDEEMDETTEVLPPSRPATQFTPISYTIAKSTMAYTLGRIIEMSNSVLSVAYEDIMTLNHDLREAYFALPSVLQVKSLEDSVMDPLNTLTMRYNICILYHKCQCVLHRKFLIKARENSRFAESRKVCVDSSMALLRYQATLHYESRPGRRLRSMRWYVNSLTAADFLLAATLVSLDLWYSAQAESLGRPTGDMELWGSSKVEEMTKALETSRDIWSELKDSSMEAYKAGEILSLMLKKVQSMHEESMIRNNRPNYPYPSATMVKETQQYSPPEEEKPEHTAAMTLGMLSSGSLGQNSGSQPYGGVFPPTPGSATTAMAEAPATGAAANGGTDAANAAYRPILFFNAATVPDLPPANLDWTAWDTYIANTTIDSSHEMLWPTSIDTGQDSQEQQQLNSNLFANAPNMFPPGTAL